MTGQMTLNETCSCSDYTTSRRSFLRNAAVVSAGAVATTMFGDAFRQASYAATNGNVMVVLSLRGGADGLSIVVPHGDAAYYDARPVIAVPRASLLVRDDMFGLHPGLKPLESMWTAGKFAAVHATGLPQPNRSHFSAIEEIEDANLGSEARTGWINRLIGLTAERSPLEAVTVGSGLLPTSMYGPEQTLATSSTDDISLSGGDDPERMRWRRQALTQVWHGTRSTLGTGARSALKTTATLGPALRVDCAPANGANYPDSDLGDAMRDTARLIKAQVGVDAVAIDYGSWDMHSSLGTLASTGLSSMNGMVGNLGTALGAFFADLGTLGSRVTLVTLTEFGRRVNENGARGLDHGWANATLVMGGGVRGAAATTARPGLAYDTLVDGDLAVTTDYRSVLCEILTRRFNASTSTVFPNFTPETVGVMA